MDKAELIQVIRTTILRRGDGTDNSPIRIITQYWSTDGDLLAENDPFARHLCRCGQMVAHEHLGFPSGHDWGTCSSARTRGQYHGD